MEYSDGDPANGGVECDFRPLSCSIFKMIQDRAINAMERQCEELVFNLSHCATCNDLDRPLTQISRSHHYATYNRRPILILKTHYFQSAYPNP